MIVNFCQQRKALVERFKSIDILGTGRKTAFS
jgi:hypothetical protein